MNNPRSGIGRSSWNGRQGFVYNEARGKSGHLEAPRAAVVAVVIPPPGNSQPNPRRPAENRRCFLHGISQRRLGSTCSERNPCRCPGAVIAEPHEHFRRNPQNLRIRLRRMPAPVPGGCQSGGRKSRSPRQPQFRSKGRIPDLRHRLVRSGRCRAGAGGGLRNPRGRRVLRLRHPKRLAADRRSVRPAPRHRNPADPRPEPARVRLAAACHRGRLRSEPQRHQFQRAAAGRMRATTPWSTASCRRI